MKEFEAVLKDHMAGNMSLVDELGSVQLAIQAAIKDAFKTPEVIKLFAKKQPEQLRMRLANLTRDHRLGKVEEEVFKAQSIEIILALKKLGEDLTAEEKHFLESSSDVASRFESADKELDSSVISTAAAGVRAAT